MTTVLERRQRGRPEDPGYSHPGGELTLSCPAGQLWEQL